MSTMTFKMIGVYRANAKYSWYRFRFDGSDWHEYVEFLCRTPKQAMATAREFLY